MCIQNVIHWRVLRQAPSDTGRGFFMSDDAPQGVESPLTRFYKNNSHSPENQVSCPNSVGFFTGIQKVEDGVLKSVSGNLPCKRWNCPVCGPKRARQVRYRVLNGDIVQAAIKIGYKADYCVKMLTLTCPGRKYRSKKTPAEAYVEMSRHFDCLIRCLKKRHGDFKYFRVYELQQDGYPHFHVVFVGQNIAHKGILAEIEDLWRNVYGMGFVRLNVVKSVEHSIRYLTKYLTKCPESVKKYSRIFSNSRGALLPVNSPKKWIFNRFWIGKTKTGNDAEIEILEHEIEPLRLPDGIPIEPSFLKTIQDEHESLTIRTIEAGLIGLALMR